MFSQNLNILWGSASLVPQVLLQDKLHVSQKALVVLQGPMCSCLFITQSFTPHIKGPSVSWDVVVNEADRPGLFPGSSQSSGERGFPCEGMEERHPPHCLL